MEVQPGIAPPKILTTILQNNMSSANKETKRPTIEHIRKGTTLKDVKPLIANSSILRKGYFLGILRLQITKRVQKRSTIITI